MPDVLGRKLGVRRLLQEGGGGINASFLAAGLLLPGKNLMNTDFDTVIVGRGAVGIGAAQRLATTCLRSCCRLSAVPPSRPGLGNFRLATANGF
jgi:hypothetical protein